MVSLNELVIALLIVFSNFFLSVRLMLSVAVSHFS